MVIKELNITNPFADNAGIVTGNRFVGRQFEIDEIHTRVLGELYGNLAIVGLPRIGKSSIVWNALIVNITYNIIISDNTNTYLVKY